MRLRHLARIGTDGEVAEVLFARPCSRPRPTAPVDTPGMLSLVRSSEARARSMQAMSQGMHLKSDEPQLNKVSIE